MEIPNKKAMTTKSFSIVVIIIVLIAGFIILFQFEEIVGKRALQISEDNKCKASVWAAIKADDWRSDVIECPTNYVEIGKQDPEKTKKTIADSIARCWDRFLEGKELLFSHDPSLFGGDKAAYCNVCSVFEFKEQEPIYDFGKYLVDNHVPFIFSGRKNQTYFEYLQGIHINEDVEDMIKNEISEDTVIDTSKKYTALFVYSKDPSPFRKAYLIKKMFAGGGPGLGAAFWYGGGYILFGKNVGAEWYANAMLVEYNKTKLKQLCEILED